eukprot:11727285-Alexandrium_andersonii.AAC.1
MSNIGFLESMYHCAPVEGRADVHPRGLRTSLLGLPGCSLLCRLQGLPPLRPGGGAGRGLQTPRQA